MKGCGNLGTDLPGLLQSNKGFLFHSAFFLSIKKSLRAQHREKQNASSRQHSIRNKMTVPRIFCVTPGNARLASGKPFGGSSFPAPGNCRSGDVLIASATSAVTYGVIVFHRRPFVNPVSCSRRGRNDFLRKGEYPPGKWFAFFNKCGILFPSRNSISERSIPL